MASLVCAVLLGGCANRIGRYGPDFYSGPDPNYFEQLVAGLTERATKEPGAVDLVMDSQKPAVHGAEAAEPFLKECLAQPPILRFAWISDVQLRQQEVRLHGPAASKVGDHLFAGLELDPCWRSTTSAATWPTCWP
jgi:hypothetical protein